MPGASAQRLIAVLRLRSGSASARPHLRHRNPLLRRRDIPRRRRSNDHDKTKNQEQPPERAAGEEEDGRSRAVG